MVKKVIFAAVIFMMTIILLELSSRWIENRLIEKRDEIAADGWQAKFFGRMLDWHEPDPELLWRFKPNLNGRLIHTDNNGMLVSDRADDPNVPAYKILLLGDSSPVGLGLSSRRQAFGEQLEGLLEIGWQGSKDVRLFNGAVSGYSSAQIVRRGKRLIEKFNPDLVIVYCGNNDASISGSLTDEQLLEGQRLSGVRRLTEKLAIYRVLRGLIQSTATQPASGANLTVRVTPEQYRENLRTLAAICHKAESPLILIKPPVPLLWPAGLQFKPFLNEKSDSGRMLFPKVMAEFLGRKLYYCIDRSELSDIYAGVDLFTEMVYEAAEPMSDSLARRMVAEFDLLSLDQLSPVELNDFGVAFWKERKFRTGDSVFIEAREGWRRGLSTPPTNLEQAHGGPIYYNAGINARAEAGDTRLVIDPSSPGYSLLDSALQLDLFSLRIKRAYSVKLDSLAGEAGVYLVDPTSAFVANGGERLFVDHCHPTTEGHLLIARQIAELIVTERLVR